MAQLFTPGRRCSTLDLLNNIAGSAAGVLAGMLFERIAGPVRKGAAEFRAPDPSALALVFCWAASLVFPFFPVMNLADWDHKLAVFAQGPAFASIPLISAAANWVAVAYMIRAMRVRRIRLWLAFSLLPDTHSIRDCHAPAAAGRPDRSGCRHHSFPGYRKHSFGNLVRRMGVRRGSDGSRARAFSLGCPRPKFHVDTLRRFP